MIAAPLWGRETSAPAGEPIRTGGFAVMEETEADEFADNSISEEELLSAARRSFLFLSACVDGEIADAKVTDRIAAARVLQEPAEGAAPIRRAHDRLSLIHI